LPGADGIKTGYTGEAHYNFLGTAQRGGRRLLMVLAGVEKPRDRTKAARAAGMGLFRLGCQALAGRRHKAGRSAGAGRHRRDVPLVAPRDFFHAAQGRRARPSMRIVYNGPLVAPIAKGTPVAELEVRAGGAPAACRWRRARMWARAAWWIGCASALPACCARPGPGREAGPFHRAGGGEGVGKSTQSRLLAEALRARGLRWCKPASRAARRRRGDPRAAAFHRGRGLGRAGRGAAVRRRARRPCGRLIRPALARGAWVVCDRFLDSSRAYQGGAGAFRMRICALHAIGSEGCCPT
jgi:hypothetical protein